MYDGSDDRSLLEYFGLYAFCNRQMEGQDLEELNIDELQKLEDAIEGGLSRVLKTKVYVNKL